MDNLKYFLSGIVNLWAHVMIKLIIVQMVLCCVKFGFKWIGIGPHAFEFFYSIKKKKRNKSRGLKQGQMNLIASLPKGTLMANANKQPGANSGGVKGVSK